MDILLWAKRQHNKMSKMKSPKCRRQIFPIIISGQGKRVCWLVGGKCVKGSCPRSTLTNNRQSQGHPNINLGQYKQLFYQPKPSQTPLTEVQKIQYFDFFEIGQVTLTPRGSIANFNLGSNEPNQQDTIWIRLFGAKDGIIKGERWPSLILGPVLFLSLYRVQAKWSVGWSLANVSKEVVSDQL